MTDNNRTPIFLLTGFLGSGKTTLLSRLVRSAGFADTAVIINELGDIGLDHLLVSEGEEIDVVLLESGCLCCTLSNSLELTLESLYYKRERLEIPPFRRVVIETTGLADPSAIAASLAGSPLLAKRFQLASIVTTVGSDQGGQQLDEFEEARLQVLLADQILVTKADRASPADMSAINQRIARLNPRAPRQPVSHGEIAAETVLRPAARSNATTPVKAQPTHGPAPAHDDHDTHTDHDGTAPANHDHLREHGYVTRVLTCPDGLTHAHYAAWVRFLQKSLGDRLLRVKGLVRWSDGKVYAVQGVRLVFEPPEAIDWAPPAEAIGKIVLIGRHLSEEDLHAAATTLVRPDDL